MPIVDKHFKSFKILGVCPNQKIYSFSSLEDYNSIYFSKSPSILTIQVEIMKQYTGLLSPEDAALGINLAISNANKLYSDADILFRNGSFATATSLAILAIEEAGKVSIIRGILTSRDQQELNIHWKRYRNHRSKNAAWIIMGLARKGAKTIFDLRDTVNDKGDHTKILDQIKQISFYTDCLAKKHWSVPDQAIDEGGCKGIMAISKILCKKSEITVRELQLWQQHMKDKPDSFVALRNWWVDMISEKLTKVTIEEVDFFLNNSN